MSGAESDALVDALASDEYEYVGVDELHKHPRNEEVYGEIDPDESFLNDIEQNGVETPLIVNEHEDTQEEWGLPNTVIGGHRRLTAAREVGLNKVPVRWKEYPEPMATRRLVHNNKQRDKSAGQETKEMLLLEEIGRKIAKENQSKVGGSDPGALRHNCDEARWDEMVAQEVGVSRQSARRGTDVYRFAYPDQYVHDDLQNAEKYDVSEEVREVAKWQADYMDANEQSYNGGHKAVKAAKEIVDIVAEVDADMSDMVEESLEQLKTTDSRPQEIKEEVQKTVERKQRQQSLKRSGATTDSSSCELIVGDVFDELTELEDNSVDLLLTDPPYGVKDEYEWDTFDEFLTFFDDWFSIAYQKLSDEHTGFVFTDARRMHDVAAVIEDYTDIRNTVVWVRKNMSKGRDVGEKFISAYEPIFYFGSRELNLPEEWGEERFDVKEFAVPQTNFDDGKYHPTQKPADLFEELVSVGSYQGDTVLDCFAGACTTGVATERVGDRETILIEQNEEYAQIGQGRINEL